MLTAIIYNENGEQKESQQLDQRIFGHKANLPVIHQYIKAYLSNQRQGTVKKKNRAEVRGGGAKPWRQKGTGRARAGSNTSPLWVGGGRTFPPRPRDFRMQISKKMKRQALLAALSTKASENRIRIIEDLNLQAPKTKIVHELWHKLGIAQSRILFLTENKDENLQKSCRNIKGLVHKRSCLVNPYDILVSDYLVLTKTALNNLSEVFAG